MELQQKSFENGDDVSDAERQAIEKDQKLWTISAEYSGGNTCDETGLPREAEVEIKC